MSDVTEVLSVACVAHTIGVLGISETALERKNKLIVLEISTTRTHSSFYILITHNVCAARHNVL